LITSASAAFWIVARFLLRAEAEVLRALKAELRPIDRTGIEVVNGQARDGFELVGQRMLGILAPPNRGGDDHAGGEQLLAGSGEERVDVLLRDRVLREVELALDGAELAGGALLGDDIDTHVADVARPRPLIPQPHAREPLGVDRIEFEVAADEALEAVAEIAVGGGGLAKGREAVVKAGLGHAVAEFAACESAFCRDGFALREDSHRVPARHLKTRKGRAYYTPHYRHLGEPSRGRFSTRPQSGACVEAPSRDRNFQGFVMDSSRSYAK
jgi:hypothetical protein